MDTQKRISKLNYTLNPILLTSEQKHSWYIVVDTLYGYTGSQYVDETRNVTLDNIALLVNGIVPAHMLPSYVDDLIFGTYDIASDIFTGVDDSTSETIYYHHPATSEQKEPESGKIYCDTSTAVQYRYSGTAVNTKYFISIPNSYTYSSGNGISISEAVYGVKEISISDTYDASVVHISGQETILNGKGFSKGAIFYGEDTFPNNVGNYVTIYNSTVYGCCVLAYNGTTYQQLNLGSMPTTNKFALSLLANGNSSIGYNVDLYNTTYSNQYGVITKNNIRFLHDFNYGNNGTVTTNGNNIFCGKNSGNFTMGSTATTSTFSSRNIGIGTESLFSNTTGYENIGLGYNTLYFNTTGWHNVGVGIQTLYSNTTGHNNIGIGTGSLHYNTTGFANVGIGNQTLYSNTTGEYNVGIGDNVLVYNTTGIRNTGIGGLALSSNTTGDYNIGIGYSSLYNNTGNRNTTIGSYSGYNITSGSNIIAIGYYSEPKTNTDTNEIIIDSSTNITIPNGNGSNTVTLGNSSMICTYLYGIIQLQNYTDATLPTLSNSGLLYYNDTQKHLYCYIDGLSKQLDSQLLGIEVVHGVMDNSALLNDPTGDPILLDTIIVNINKTVDYTISGILTTSSNTINSSIIVTMSLKSEDSLTTLQTFSFAGNRILIAGTANETNFSGRLSYKNTTTAQQELNLYFEILGGYSGSIQLKNIVYSGITV